MLLIVPFVGFDPRAFSGEPRAVQHEKEQIPQYVEEWSIERLLIFFFFFGGGWSARARGAIRTRGASGKHKA